MPEMKQFLFTEEDLKNTQEEYDHLVHVVREEVKNELKEARSLGDLSENADYDAARDKQARVESRIVELEYMLSHYSMIKAEAVAKKSKSTVNITTTVTLRFEDTGLTETYTIVGSTGADPLNGKISNETPLANAIMDHKAGDTVTVHVAKPYKVTILSVK